MEKEEEILNKILVGEIMASNIIQTYLNSMNDDSLKDQMMGWLNEHKNNAQLISTYLMKHGQNAATSGGMIGLMSQAKALINTWKNGEPLDILREIYDGEDKGIARSVQLAKDNLSPEATQLIEGVFSKDHNHLKEMKNLISDYENHFLQ